MNTNHSSPSLPEASASELNAPPNQKRHDQAVFTSRHAIASAGKKLWDSIERVAGLRLIAIADVDNLVISALRVFHSSVDPYSLRRFIGRNTRGITATAVLTTKPEFSYTTEEWSDGGWNVVPIFRERVRTIRGEEHLANADLDIAFEAGAMVSGHPHADGLLLLTGDGTLATAIARDVKRRRPGMAVIAAAIPGTASNRLRDTGLFDAFIPLDHGITRFQQMNLHA